MVRAAERPGCALLVNLLIILNPSSPLVRAQTTAENEDSENKRKTESLWPIMQIVHTRSRYIYDLFYEREAISRELYDWLLKQGYADAGCANTNSVRQLQLLTATGTG